jgi:hypothetical protein
MAQKKRNADEPTALLGKLVDGLGPINNECRNAEGIDKVELLWDLGDTLLALAPTANDQLLREIHEHSYITRDILRYGLIVRRGWQDRRDLRKHFPQLSRYSLFREALPFLKGDRCGIGLDVHETIVALLNDGDTKKAKTYLKQMKEERIGRKHQKGQAADRMSTEVESLRRAITQLNELAIHQFEELTRLAERMGGESAVQLSQACVAVADNAPIPPIPPVADACEPLAGVCASLARVSSAGREERNGFRRAIGPVALLELADLLNAMRSKELLLQWQQRRHLKLTV